jgi:hypothetical protein
VIVYAYVVIEYCDELFMMLKCVVWLKYENDDMHIFVNCELIHMNETMRSFENFDMKMY